MIVDGGNLDDAHQVGTTFLPDGSTLLGGHGNPVQGVTCGAADLTFAQFTHLSIFLNGQQLALPARIGIERDLLGNLTCVYGVHTHTGDRSGRIHQEGPAPAANTLGQFFAIWGVPLTPTNVAGIVNLPVTVYITDNGTVTPFSGDPATIELRSHRHIALVLGTPITQVPVYSWTGS